MRSLPRYIRALFTRLIPAVLTATGVVIVTAGLLAYGDPATAGAMPSPSASGPGPLPSLSLGLPTIAPSQGTASGSPTPSSSTGPAVATRLVVPALRIDLPVVQGPPGYPYCGVAMYYVDNSGLLGQPGSGKPTYLFAHARDGMFGPIYNLTIVQRTPDKMVGMLVQVYTSDNKLYQYEITAVYPHQLNMNRAFDGNQDELWLQTSEGPHGTPGKTQVLAMPLSVWNVDPKLAHPALPAHLACPDAPAD
ncbi:MAG TPA: sortase [Candidatus Limnocylindrales bacterium]